jgi:hypothetical protein
MRFLSATAQPCPTFFAFSPIRISAKVWSRAFATTSSGDLDRRVRGLSRAIPRRGRRADPKQAGSPRNDPRLYRALVAPTKPISFRRQMDEGGTLIVNLAKGRL